MKRLIINAITACLFMLISFGTFAQSTVDMKSFITKTNQEMMDLIKSGNYNALDKYYDAEAVSLPNYRAAENGSKLILNNNLGRQKGGYKILDGQKSSTKLVIGADMIVDIGTYTLTMTFPGLTEPKVDNGKYLNVWKKNSEGAWKLVAETWNADKSPNAPASKPGQPGSMPAPTGVQNAKPGTQPGTTAPGTTGSGGKSTQSSTGNKTIAVPAQGTTGTTKGSAEAKPAATGTTTSGSKAVPATGTTTTKGTTETKPAQTGTASGSKAVPAQGTTTTKGTTETKPAQTGTASGSKAVPASGTTTTKGTTETKSTQTGTTKTGTVTSTGTTTTKSTTETEQKTPVADPNAGKK